jgi:D-cysteine desulfhydrase
VIPLFEHHPPLKEQLPYVRLGNYPTPITKLNKVGAKIGLPHLYMKEDGLTGELYGGNKIRKLEFVLGDALRQGAKEVLTFGFAGSNHALATAICAKQLGLKSISMLMPQHNAHYVRRNLLMSKHVGVEFHQHMNKRLLLAGARYQILRHERKTGKAPYVIPPGGSSPLGTIGFVNAAFELGNQIVQKELPEPDRIYVPLGTGGTAVGLMIGLRALNLKSTVIPVRVADHALTPEKAVRKLYSKTVSLLRSHDPSFPDLELSTDALEVVDEYLGDGYAQFAKAGAKTIVLV